MFWLGRRPSVDEETEEWLIACWRWLLDNLDDLERLRGFPLVLPNTAFFPPTRKEGHERAGHYFRTVAELSGTAAWPFDLIPQQEGFNPNLGPLAVVQNVEPGPAGTFSFRPGQRLTVSYDPDLLERPMDLIATFIHEIAHAILMGIEQEVPGGGDMEEYATDVATVFLGFGVFGANAAFEFQQFSDAGTGTQGWSMRGAGYLTEAEWAFAIAIFLSLRNESIASIAEWLKPTPGTLLKKSMRYLDRYPDRLSALR